MTLPRVALVLLLSWPGAVLAHDGHAHDNIKVLRGLDEKSLDAGMKAWSKALGVQCTACHVKQKWASDDVPAKLAARAFLEKTLADPSAEGRAQALTPLLAALDRKAVKDQAKLWAAIDRWRALVPPGAPAEEKQKEHGR
jgi:hypothetical protein